MSIEAARLEIKVDTDATGAINDLRRVDERVDHTGSRFRGLATTAGVALGTMGAAAVGLLGYGIFQLGKWGLDTAIGMQQAQRAFTGILGDAGKANQFIDELKQFAIATPFELPTLVEAGKQMLATGNAAETIVPKLQKLGDLGALLGASDEQILGVVRAMGQMSGKGKASAEELMQISEALPGFSPIQAIAEGLGISMPEAFKKLESGAIPADVALNAIYDGMAKFPGAAGAMDGAAQSLEGRWSSFKDTLGQVLSDGLTPLLPALAEHLGKATQWLTDHRDQIIDAIRTAIDWVVENFPKIARKIGEVISWVVDNWPTISRVISTVASTIGTIISMMVAAFDWLTSAFRLVSVHFGTIAYTIASGFGSMASFIQGAVSSIAGVVGFMMSVFRSMGSAAADGVSSVIGWFSGIGGRIMGMFSGAGGWLVSAGRAIMDGLLDGIRDAWGAVANFVGGLASKIKSLKGPLDYDARLLIPAGNLIMEGLHKGLAQGWVDVQGLVATMAPSISATVTAGAGLPASAAPAAAGTVVHVTNEFHGLVTDKVGTGEQVARSLEEYLRFGGTIQVAG